MTSLAVRHRAKGGLGDTAKALREAASSEIVGMIGGFLVLRLIATAHSPVPYSDTATYEILNFVGGSIRLWTVPLIWNVFPGADLHVVVQIVIGMVAWSMLAAAVWGALRDHWVRRIGTAAVLMLGLVPQVTGWDATLLSESLSHSLVVLEVALLLRLRRGADPRALAACVVVAALWMFTRQVNVVLYIAFLPVGIGFAVAWLPRRRAVATIVAIVVIGGYGAFVITRDNPGANAVWHSNALGIIVNRIAMDPSALQYFEAHGLPPSPELARERGRFLGGTSPLWQDERFMRWVQDQFRQTYFGYLLRHPRLALWDPVTQITTLGSAPLPEGRATSVLPDPLAQALWSSTPGDILFWGVAALVLVVMAWAARCWNRLLAVPAVVVVAGVALAVISYDASGVDPYRYFVPVGLLVRLGLLLAIAVSVDALVASHRRRRPQTS